MKHYITLLIALYFPLLLLDAHESRESYLFLEFHEGYIEGRVEFRHDELKDKLGVDVMENGEMSPEKLRAQLPQVEDYIRKNLSIGTDASNLFEFEFVEPAFFKPEGIWAQYNFRMNVSPTPPQLYIDYNMGFENDPMHRGVVLVEEGDWPEKGYHMLISMVFSPFNRTQFLDTVNPPEVMNPKRMVWQGMLHIWLGIDHVLFLIALALPIVLIRQDNKWEPAPKLHKSLWSLLKIVTVFTVAHSITLLLASLGIVSINSRLVESIIALSIIIVAVSNIIGKSHRTSLLVILFLGLFHGLGFASVMGELPFRLANFREFLLMIVGFNVGVELGQIAILLVAFPLLFIFRKSSYYTPLVLTGGSAALVMIAGYWFIQRAFDL